MNLNKLLIVLITIVSMACNPKSSAISKSNEIQKIEIMAYYQSSGKLGYLVENVKIVDDHLIFNVVYTGGCKTHTFRLIGDSAMSDTKPVHTNLFLVHENNGENCTTEIKKELVFDIARLKNLHQNPLLLNIDHLNSVLYQYK